MLAYLIPLAAVLCGAASAARAACALQLDGDPEVVAPVRVAMDTFRDDGATCVDVRALCSRDASDIVVDLRDQLGRSVQRRFTTPEGAAAFLISWSRRPLPQTGTGLEPSAPPPAGSPPKPAPTAPNTRPPGATQPSVARRSVATPPSGAPPGATPPAATQPRARLSIAGGIPGLAMAASVPITETAETPAASAPFAFTVHPEVRASYISAPFGASTVDGLAGVLDAAFLLHRGSARFGVDVRAIGAEVSQRNFDETVHLKWIELEAEAVVGWRAQLNRIALESDLFAGVGAVSVTSKSDSPRVEARTRGLRGGARVAAASQLFSTVWFEARMGWDGLRQLGLSGQSDDVLRSDRYLGQLHLEIGLLWAP